MGREKKGIIINTVILKVGLALAFSLGGMLCTFLKTKRIKLAKSPSHHSNSSSDCNDHQGISPTSELQFDPLAKDEHSSLSDKDSYLLPEFNYLMKEFDLTAMKTNPELPVSDTNSPPKVNSTIKTDSHEQELKSLKHMVDRLKERERNLEAQLLEYYSLKEQETAVMELRSRLKLNSMEAKLLALKVQSLETDNKRLKSETADYNKVFTDLEAARTKIKVLQKKLRSEVAQNKERILDLQQRVEKMQVDDHKHSIRIDPEIELKLCKLENLEAEVNELRQSNNNLEAEKSELAQRLEHVKVLATSKLEDQEKEKLKKESEHLKKQNEELTNEIEKLQEDRCSDVEELVYMRWVNACLRYELRNYQPGPGKTMARDLSKTLSPKSEEKAKRLILEYANQEGDGTMGINIPELDSDQWSSPPSSSLLDSGEFDEPLVDHPASRKRNYKFFGKFVKFLKGKDGNSLDHQHDRHHSQCSHSRTSSFERTESTGEDMNSYSDYSFGLLGNSSKHSMDSQRSFHIHRHSESAMYKRIDSIAEGGDTDDGLSGSFYGQKSEVAKYAEVLQDSNPKPPTRYRRRSTFSSF